MSQTTTTPLSILVLGATGNVGTCVVKHLKALSPPETHVIAGTRDPSSGEQLGALYHFLAC